jgi:hypothetical protein
MRKAWLVCSLAALACAAAAVPVLVTPAAVGAGQLAAMTASVPNPQRAECSWCAEKMGRICVNNPQVLCGGAPYTLATLYVGAPVNYTFTNVPAGYTCAQENAYCTGNGTPGALLPREDDCAFQGTVDGCTTGFLDVCDSRPSGSCQTADTLFTRRFTNPDTKAWRDFTFGGKKCVGVYDLFPERADTRWNCMVKPPAQ